MAVDQGGTLRSNVFPLTQSPRTSTTCMYIRNTGGCPFVTNYLLIADSDHSGDTINAGVPSIDPAADCASESTCTAFTSNGDLKTMSYPVFQSPGTCLYLKLAPLIDSITCGTISDKYNYIAGVTNGAASYNLIGTIFEDANCWFKTCHYWYYKYGMTQTSWGSAPTSIRNAWNLTPCDDAILQCPVIPGYIANTDVTHTGDFMGDAWTTSAAATSCSSDTQCRAFDDNGGMVIAYLPLATSEGRCLYVKIRPANPPPPPRPPPRSPSPPPPVPPSPILYPSPPSPRPPSS
ncbi:hypothetical protein Vretifemale_17085, partial [Volvox reticuliferus]